MSQEQVITTTKDCTNKKLKTAKPSTNNVISFQLGAYYSCGGNHQCSTCKSWTAVCYMAKLAILKRYIGVGISIVKFTCRWDNKHPQP